MSGLATVQLVKGGEGLVYASKRLKLEPLPPSAWSALLCELRDPSHSVRFGVQLRRAKDYGRKDSLTSWPSMVVQPEAQFMPCYTLSVHIWPVNNHGSGQAAAANLAAVAVHHPRILGACLTTTLDLVLLSALMDPSSVPASTAHCNRAASLARDLAVTAESEFESISIAFSPSREKVWRTHFHAASYLRLNAGEKLGYDGWRQ
ncbi:uncharacterized protein MYCFIDRAFT_174239 [Pseudocercospora fijiensis CIRAD86]|uniref:Uncharacterized protein n=1 Tax=Pseudocercospora fijiensis (strain CIRAD86) TaxID=383855 RepID=M2ZUK4_PSEFD|nr:uncharacterized protein MYCFIDRAFT_174239 [Pseudocercospora fijiensis CIRAD86]EME82684.1 hypothetical protein MYCFIDRAFT_174239 [Pseudocercospora fijiensis CIRAD86]